MARAWALFLVRCRLLGSARRDEMREKGGRKKKKKSDASWRTPFAYNVVVDAPGAEKGEEKKGKEGFLAVRAAKEWSDFVLSQSVYYAYNRKGRGRRFLRDEGRDFP